tara:strand:+ start:379 stop:558 length:180 start_codon:yes stop_codon:yes gene_type:complete
MKNQLNIKELQLIQDLIVDWKFNRDVLNQLPISDDKKDLLDEIGEKLLNQIRQQKKLKL